MVDMKIGTVDRTVVVFIPDPASTDGSGKTGLVAANLTVSNTRVETDNDVIVTDYTSSLSNLSALTDAHADWGLKEISSTLAPGLYRLDVADAVFAAGAWSSALYVMITTSAAAATPMLFRLGTYDPFEGTNLMHIMGEALSTTGKNPFFGLVDRGTAQSATGTTLVLRSAAAFTDDQVNGAVIVITGGTTGVGERRVIRDYVLSTDTATVDAWTTTPTGTITYEIYAAPPNDSVVQTGDAYARLGAPAGASVSADIAAIEAQTDDIGAAGAGLTAVPWNAAWDAQVESEVQDAIVVNHLDHLLAVDYDPASKPGVATALLNELIESDAGVSRYTVNALEQGPSGSGASAASIADAVWDEAISGHLTGGTTGLALNSASSAGDPWSTAIPGAYGAGTAGSRLGKLPDATAGAAGGVFIAGTNAATAVTTALTANVTGNLSGSVGSVASGGITAASFAADAITAAKIAADVTTELQTGLATAASIAALSIPTAIQNADAVLSRDIGSGTNAVTLNERTVRAALRFNRNKFTIVGGTLTVYCENDTTVAFTAAITQTAGNPVSASDPV